MRRFMSVALAALMALLLAAPAGAAGHLPTLGEQIVSDADGVFDSRNKDYDIIGEVVLAILGAAAAGDVETSLGAALDPDAELTVFLPNDLAFRRLAYDLTGQWLPEQDVIPALLDAVGGDLQLINEVVEYHVVPGYIDSATAAGADGVSLTTVQGASFTVDVDTVVGLTIRLIDNEPDLRDPLVDLRNLDYEASNGIWHGINRVLIPVDL